jgi:hypothetical protein
MTEERIARSTYFVTTTRRVSCSGAECPQQNAIRKGEEHLVIYTHGFSTIRFCKTCALRMAQKIVEKFRRLDINMEEEQI